ncbi:MAG: Holliday junction branch migration protein RuvA [Patescibacteria group bacterium]
MIFSLFGKVTYKGEDFLVLEVNRIGYQVFVNQNLLEKVKLNENLKIFTYLYRWEEKEELYGFETIEELNLFKNLLPIPGVGPKIARSILSLGKISEIKKAIQEGNVSFLTKVAGIGKKTAERVIVEFGGKIEEVWKPKILDKKIISALSKLGYRKDEIKEIISKIPSEITETEERLKYALKILGKK